MNVDYPAPAFGNVRHELERLSSHWFWFTLMGALLATLGTLAIVLPAVTIETSLAIPVVLGIFLMIGGVATIVSAFWAGRWSGFVVQLLVGLLYLACGFVFTENPIRGAAVLTLFVAVMFIVMGIFRTVGALVLQFPQWGWALLNGVITLLAGIVIYRNYPEDTLWVLGLLIGLEMLFNGWTWIMLSFALRGLQPRTN